MARGDLASAQETPLMDAIVAANQLNDVFSHCLASSGIGGLLTIGGISPYAT